MAVSESARTPIPIDSPRLRPRLRSAYRNPTSRTTNDAPSREPESIVNVWSWVVAPPTYRLSATAAIGDPQEHDVGAKPSRSQRGDRVAEERAVLDGRRERLG